MRAKSQMNNAVAKKKKKKGKKQLFRSVSEASERPKDPQVVMM
jgi:ribosomal protein S26